MRVCCVRSRYASSQSSICSRCLVHNPLGTQLEAISLAYAPHIQSIQTLTKVFRHQILKPAEKKQKYVYGGMSTGRPVTPPRKQKNKK